MPEGAVYVGRGSKWGNPYAVGSVIGTLPNGAVVTRDNVRCVRDYRQFICEQLWKPTENRLVPTIELAGKDLACWCRLDRPCHADVLLALANPVEE